MLDEILWDARQNEYDEACERQHYEENVDEYAAEEAVEEASRSSLKDVYDPGNDTVDYSMIFDSSDEGEFPSYVTEDLRKKCLLRSLEVWEEDLFEEIDREFTELNRVSAAAKDQRKISRLWAINDKLWKELEECKDDLETRRSIVQDLYALVGDIEAAKSDLLSRMMCRTVQLRNYGMFRLRRNFHVGNRSRSSHRKGRTCAMSFSRNSGNSPGDDSGGSEPPQGDPDLPSRPLIGGYPLVFPSQLDSILPSWRPARPGLMSHVLLRGWSR